MFEATNIHVYECMWRPEVGIRCFSQFFSPCTIKAMFLSLNRELATLASLESYFYLLRLGTQAAYHILFAIYGSSRDLNIGPHT